MALRQRLVKGRLQPDDLPVIGQGCQRDPVGGQGFQTSKAHPTLKKSAITQATDGDLLVVAFQENTFVCLGMCDQAVDGLARRRPAIDIVAQKNANRSGGGTRRHVVADPRQQFIEKVEAAMDVADGVNPYTGRQRRTPSLDLKPLNSGNLSWHGSTRHRRTGSVKMLYH